MRRESTPVTCSMVANRNPCDPRRVASCFSSWRTVNIIWPLPVRRDERPMALEIREMGIAVEITSS